MLHLTGPADFDEAKGQYEDCPLGHHVAPFCHELAKAYTITDLVVARSGASTLNELATLGIPSILVPYPHAADLHQHANAKIFTEAGAATLADEADTTPEGLAGEILRILGDRLAHSTMGDAMRSLAPDQATAEICDIIEASAARE